MLLRMLPWPFHTKAPAPVLGDPMAFPQAGCPKANRLRRSIGISAPLPDRPQQYQSRPHSKWLVGLELHGRGFEVLVAPASLFLCPTRDGRLGPSLYPH